MNTKEILLQELGEKRVAELEDRGLLSLIQWSMIQYNENMNKTQKNNSICPECNSNKVHISPYYKETLCSECDYKWFWDE